MRRICRCLLALSLVALLSRPWLARRRTDCSMSGQSHFVRSVLREYYYWYQQIPDPDPGQFPSPEAYLQAVRRPPLDESYSYIADQAESDAFFSESQYVGVGVSYRQTSATDLRVTQVFPGSPAADAGWRAATTCSPWTAPPWPPDRERRPRRRVRSRAPSGTW